jgi:general secretion pathway protein G
MRLRGLSPSAARRPSPGEAGFSLLELMVVVVILSILALVVMPRVIDRPDQARVARVRSDLAALESAVELYRLDNHRYPTTEQGLQALVEEPTTEPTPPNWAPNGYIDRLPKDPWGNEFQYLQPGVHGPFDIFTLGADGARGGTGIDADIGTWTEE